MTWEGNQPRSRTVKRSSTDLTKNLPHYAVFNLIRADYGQEKVVESRKLAKLTLKIDKAYLDLKFNHICKTEELTPNSLKFSPPSKKQSRFQDSRKIQSTIFEVAHYRIALENSRLNTRER